jgi:serine/threonine protein kinase
MTKAILPSGNIPSGTLIHDRYEVQRSLGRHGLWEMLLSFDRVAGHDVVLEVVRLEEDLPWTRDPEEWVPLAQRVRHPNVCRVHGIEHGPWGPVVVTEYVAGPSLHLVIRARKATGGMAADELRSIATGLFRGLAAIHAEGVIHGDIKPGKMIIGADRAVIHRFWFAESADVAARRMPDGGTPNYMSPERRRNGSASLEDDVYAMALTLWEVFTCRVPEPGYDPRARPMKEQLRRENPAAGLTAGELRQLFRALHRDPGMRPKAGQMCFDATTHGELPASDEDDRLFAGWTGLGAGPT